MPSANPSTASLKIVVIDPWATAIPGQGLERTTVITQGLVRAGHGVSLIALQPALTRRFGHPASARPGFGYGLKLLWRLIRQPAADVVMLRYPPRAGTLVSSCFALFSGAPLVVDAAELTADDPQRNIFARMMDGLALRVLSWKAAHVLAASTDIKTWFESRGFAPAAISIVPDGADTALFAPTRDVTTTLFDKYPQLLRGPLCIYAGGLHRGRHLAELLEIAAAMQTVAPDVRFAIIGDGPDRLDLNAYAARLDVLEKNVWFIPAIARAELPPVLHAASIVLALPSRWSEAGLDAASHIFDGLAAGKPIAVLGEGWQRDLIDGRQAGVALPSDNAEGAARELADFLRDGDLVRRAGEQALALARGKHNAERVLTEIRQTLEKIAATQSRHEVLRHRALSFKRGLDVVVSLAALIVLSPIMVLIALGFAAAGWLPLAGRLRSGQRAKPFRLWTFDTMKAERETVASWRTGFAHFLRRSALDRLPELFNVLMGDMSLVGPRPLPAEYAAYYTETQLRRLDLRPGITGWAQVNGRKGLSWDDMFAHDAWYVTNFGLGLDLKILWRTLIGLLLGRGLGCLPAGQLPRFDEIEARRQGAEDA